MYRSEEEIKRSMLNQIKNTVDKTQNSFVHDALAPASIELARFYMDLEYIANKLDVENLTGEDLDRFIRPRTGLSRKGATKANTYVTVSGQEGAVINIGDLFSTGDVDFEATEYKVIDATGKADVLVTCTVAGSAGNAPVGAINQVVSRSVGLADVYNPEAVTNGYEKEEDDDYRQRYYDKLQRPGKAGNVYHYLEWANEVPGVGGCRVIPLWDGPLTVKVILIDQDGQPADQRLVDAVKEKIEDERPFGAKVTVVAATPVQVEVKVDLVLESGYEIEDVHDNIKNNIVTYLSGIAFKENSVSYAKIGYLILEAYGVIDYCNLLINFSNSNITLKDDEVAVMWGEVKQWQ